MSEENLATDFDQEPKRKAIKKAPPAKVRKHLLTTAFTNDVTKKLDILAAAGHTLVAVVRDPDIRGFNIISYLEE